MTWKRWSTSSALSLLLIGGCVSAPPPVRIYSVQDDVLVRRQTHETRELKDSQGWMCVAPEDAELLMQMELSTADRD